MTKVEREEFLADIICEATVYRMARLVKLVSLFQDSIIDGEIIKKLINPFLEQLIPMLEKRTLKKLSVKLDNFIPEVNDLMFIYPYMHYWDNTGVLNQKNADALLVMFLHYSYNIPKLHSECLILR